MHFCDIAVCILSLRCYIQAASKQLFLLHILVAPQSPLHHPHAHGQCHAYWQSPGPIFRQGPAHLSQADAALQPGIRLPAGEYWTSHHWDPRWSSSGRAGCSAASLPLSLPPSGWVSSIQTWVHVLTVWAGFIMHTFIWKWKDTQCLTVMGISGLKHCKLALY